MQLRCPNCGQAIHAENINVQELVAVCANCDTVFKFSAPDEKAKRRKVKQPQNLILRDAETLEMSFRTNWRLGQNQDFIGAITGAVIVGLLAIIMLNGYFSGKDMPLFLPIGMGVVSLFFSYLSALVAYNQTHIVMDDEKISVSRQPIPSLGNELEISLYGIESIKCEETTASKERGYDLPRYRVWAETADASRRLIINDVTEEYAYFISQRLNERLHFDMDVSHLEDADYQRETLSDLEQIRSQSDYS